MKGFKLIKYASLAINWMHLIDSRICSGRSNTNKYFGTLFFYTAMYSGVDSSSLFDLMGDRTLDAILSQMTPQVYGMGIVLATMLMLESVTLCRGTDNIFMRFVIDSVICYLAYMAGVVFSPVCTIVLWVAVACYLTVALYGTITIFYPKLRNVINYYRHA